MTQTTPLSAVPTAPGHPSSAPGHPSSAPGRPSTATGRTPAVRAGRIARLLRQSLRGTPGRLRLVSAALVVAGLLLGLGAAQAFHAAQGALHRADRNAAQLVRLQDIRTSLVRADADATNAFLVGGLEPVEQRHDYVDAVRRASSQLAFAARAQPADGDALAALSSSVQDFTGLVETARADNRQGLPLGAQYLRDASAGLRSTSLPLLESLTAANQKRVEVEFSGARRALAYLLVAGLLALVAVVAASVWLARRTHRYLNLPVLAGFAVVVVTLVLGTVVLTSVGRVVSQVRSGPYAQARALAEARVSAFDAKSNESLTLISRGSGAAFEKAWQAASAATQSHVAGTSELDSLWSAYAQQHRAIRALDDGGQWEKAVAAATSRQPGSANAEFAAFDQRSGALLTSAGDSTTGRLADAGRGLGVATWLAVLAGLGTAALCWWGLGQRIEEYR